MVVVALNTECSGLCVMSHANCCNGWSVSLKLKYFLWMSGKVNDKTSIRKQYMLNVDCTV